ncbi:MAG TPA: hypothetical protein VHM26_15385, partial [Chitinophagaceae bacterium]|nr:hypothetical protein [Chitinophagaceae bacterium]
MKHIALILPYDYSLFTVATILDVLSAANRMQIDKKKEVPFKLTIFQTAEQIAKHGKTFHGCPVRSIRSNVEADIVLIPGFAATTDIKTTLEY